MLIVLKVLVEVLRLTSMKKGFDVVSPIIPPSYDFRLVICQYIATAFTYFF